MTNPKLAHLKELAEKHKKDYWFEIIGPRQDYILACAPKNILALVSALEKTIDALEWHAKNQDYSGNTMSGTSHQKQAEISLKLMHEELEEEL